MKLGIITSGGDAPGMNAAIGAATRYARSRGIEMFGYVGGYRGVIEHKTVDLAKTSFRGALGRGGTLLYTDRCEEFLLREYRLQAYDNLRSDGVEGLVAVGGDGTFRGARDFFADTGLPIACVPATIDNDLGYTEFTIGFDTALNNVVNAVEAIKDTAESHGKVSFVEVMGRKCGNIALHSGVASGADFILVPERSFDFEELSKKAVEKLEAGHHSIIFIVAEGVGKVSEMSVRFKELTGITPRETSLGFIQRGGNPTYADRMLGVRMGATAVDLLAGGCGAVAVGVRGGEIFDTDLAGALGIPSDIDQTLYDLAPGIV